MRLKGWDYGKPAYYFITICCQDKECLFGDVVDGKMLLNKSGQFVMECWKAIPEHFPHAAIHEFVIMPNHIHGIIQIKTKFVRPSNELEKMKYEGGNHDSPLHQTTFRSPSMTIGSIVRGFKIGVTKWMRQNTNVFHVWQRDYYDDIIWNQEEFERIVKYIQNNPLNWNKKRNPKK